MKHRFLILFLFLSYFGFSQTEIPLAGFRATLNSFPTISGDTMTATFTLLDVSNQFNGNSLKTRDSLVLWKNCKRYRIDTVLTSFATQVTVKLLKGGNPSLTPGICALVEENKANKSFAPFSVTDGERQCIQSYYAGNDSLSILDTIFINDSLYYVLNGDTINVGYVNTIPTKVKDTPTMKLRIVSDTIRADIKKRLNSGNVGGIDKWSYIEFDSTGQITNVATALDDDLDKDPYNEFQNLTIDSIGRRFTLGIIDGNEVSFVDQVGVTDTAYINQLISDSIAAIAFPKDSLYANGDPGHISIIGGNEVDINVNDADSNPTNEIQTLSFSMPNLSIGGGNTVNLTGLINDADSNPYNELQTISIIDSTDRVFQIRLHPENQVISFRDSVGLTEMDTSLISQIISDSLSAYTFETDTSLINQLISDSLATINQDQIVSITDGGITTVTGTYPNFNVTSTEVDGSTTNEKINSISWNNAQDSLQVIENGIIYRTKITGFLTQTDTALINTIVTNSLDTLTLPRDSTTLLGGTGITAWESPANTWNIQNDDPDQTVTLTPTGIVSISGAYPNFTIGATEVDGDPNNEKQTLSQSFTGTTEATYTLSNSGGSVKDTTGYMRLETMFSTAGSRTYRYKSNLGAIMGITEDPTLSGDSNIEVLRTGNQLTWGLRKDNASNGQIYKYNGTAWALSNDVSGITSLNGLTPSTQTFATGTSGTDFNISSSTSTHTFNFPTASASNRGLLSSADHTLFSNKIGGGGTLNYVPLWSSGSALTNSVIFQNGSNVGVGTTTTTYNGLPNRLAVNGSIYLNPDLTGPSGIIVRDYTSRLSFWESNTNATRLDIGYLSTGPIWLRQSGQLIMGDYDVSSSITLTGSSKVFTISGENSGIIVDASGNKRVGFMKYSGLETSFVHANNIPLRFGMVGATSVTGVGTGYTETMRCHTNGNVGIGETSPSRKLDVNGEARIRDLTTTSPNGLVGKDADGVLSAVTLGTGLSFSGTTLNATATGTVTGTGTTNAIPYFTSTTALGSTPFTYNSNIMTIPTGNSIYFPGTATIIDKNASGGSEGEFLSKAFGGGVDWMRPIFTIRDNIGGSGFIESDGTDILDIRAGTNTLVQLNSGTPSNPIFTVSSNVAHAMMNNTANITGLTLDAAYRKITFNSGGIANKVTFSDANDRLTVTETGTYEITYSFSLQTSSPYQATVYANLYKNGSSVGYSGETIFRNHDNTSSNFTSVCKTFFLTLNSTDYIELFYGNSPATTTCSILNANVTVKRIN